MEYAHKHNCVVEGSWAIWWGGFDEEKKAAFIQRQAKHASGRRWIFAALRRGLAGMAIGNSHGAYKFKGSSI
jgi:fructose/tagatose bisphosphate aldolase